MVIYQPTLQLIMLGWIRWQYIPVMVWCLCGNIYLHLHMTLLVIMSSGPLQPRLIFSLLTIFSLSSYNYLNNFQMLYFIAFQKFFWPSKVKMLLLVWLARFFNIAIGKWRQVLTKNALYGGLYDIRFFSLALSFITCISTRYGWLVPCCNMHRQEPLLPWFWKVRFTWCRKLYIMLLW